MPNVGVRVLPTMQARRISIELDEVPVLEGDIPAGRVLLDDDPIHLQLLDVECHEHPPLSGRAPGLWVDDSELARLEESGIGYRTVERVLCDCLERVLGRYAGEFVGIQETRALLSRMEQDYAELVGEAIRVVSLQKMADVLRRLVEEGVPIRALRTILEAMVTWGGQEQNECAWWSGFAPPCPPDMLSLRTSRQGSAGLGNYTPARGSGSDLAT